jgi:methylenetetrahydrofolate dehydrogenase (NADP+)/methenyltetrahydrofolate cyclohydrolase
MQERITNSILELKIKTSLTPTLAIILVGNDSSSVTYTNMKAKKAKQMGIDVFLFHLEDNSSTEDVLKLLDTLNKDDRVDGIIIQHPMNKQINETLCFKSIAIEKDVDGLNPYNLGLLTTKTNLYSSATPKGIIDLLEYYKFNLEGLHAVVIGRSQILGKPIALMLLNCNCTVTICHSKTKNIEEIVKSADLVVAALGQANFVKSSWLKQGVILIDAGYNKGNVGDIDMTNCLEKALAYTPVPGGVGPMTIIELLGQTYISFKNSEKVKINV